MTELMLTVTVVLTVCAVWTALRLTRRSERGGPSLRTSGWRDWRRTGWWPGGSPLRGRTRHGPSVVARADPMEARLCAAEAGITAHLLAGRLSVGVYHQAMAALAAEDARRRPVVVPHRRR